MNENYTALQIFARGLIGKVKELIENAKFDRTYTGVVSSVESDGYIIQYAGKSIKIKEKNINMYKAGDMVKICIPMADSKKAYIVQSLSASRYGARFYPCIANNYVCTTSSVTGMLKIKLPTYYANKMISMDVRIYTYTNQGMATFHVGGYDYNQSKSWYNMSAYCEANNTCGIRNRSVSFGNDGNNSCIYIGSYTDTWAYPQVCVTNILIGYSAETLGQGQDWYNDIELSFVTSGQTLQTTFPNVWTGSN